MWVHVGRCRPWREYQKGERNHEQARSHVLSCTQRTGTHIYTHQWTLASAMGVCVVEVDVRG